MGRSILGISTDQKRDPTGPLKNATWTRDHGRVSILDLDDQSKERGLFVGKTFKAYKLNISNLKQNNDSIKKTRKPFILPKICC